MPALDAREATSIHRIDAADRIVFVNEPWLNFAREQGMAHLSREAVIGRSLWDFIGGEGTRAVWEEILRAVRTREQSFDIVVPVETPGAVFRMEMRVAATRHGGIEFATVVTSREKKKPRPRVAGRHRRSQRPLQICPSCRAWNVQGRWQDIADALRAEDVFRQPDARFASGLCDECREERRPLAEQIASDSFHLANHFLRLSRRALRSETLTQERLRGMALIHAHQPVGLTALAELEGVNASSVWRLVQALHEAGLVHRHQDGKDRRSVRVSLTPEGEAAYRGALEAATLPVAQIAMTLDDASLVTLSEAMRIALRHVDLPLPAPADGGDDAEGVG